jgi:hypothetical protein
MKPYLHDNSYFMWNLDASVGKGGANNVQADICYLQWYYTLASTFPDTPAERKEIYKKVAISGGCSGRDDDPLVQAIIAQQRALNHPIIDGRASVLPGVAGSVRLGDHKAFFIIRLGARLASKFPQQWPRLDQMPRCPSSVAAAVMDCIPSI